MTHRNIHVYAPFSGNNWGQEFYCFREGEHDIVNCGMVGWGKPIDIGGAAFDTPVKFYSGRRVRSIKTVKVDCICTSGITPWTYGVLVEMYLDQFATKFIGTVMYGHVDLRISDGQYTDIQGLQLGRLPADCAADPACDCAIGIHVHMQAQDPPSGSANYSYSFACDDPLYEGVTSIYKFTPDHP